MPLAIQINIQVLCSAVFRVTYVTLMQNTVDIVLNPALQQHMVEISTLDQPGLLK